MPIDQFLGWTATVLFTVCYIPQILKTIRTGTIDGVSVWMFLIQFVANVIALAYAIRIEQQPLITKYILAIVFVGVALTAIGLTWFEKRRMALRTKECPDADSCPPQQVPARQT